MNKQILLGAALSIIWLALSLILGLLWGTVTAIAVVLVFLWVTFAFMQGGLGANSSKVWLVLRWGAFLGILVWGVISLGNVADSKQAEKIKLLERDNAEQRAINTNEYTTSWECLPGEVASDGRKESGPRPARIESREGGKFIIFNVFYDNQDRTKFTWIRIENIGGNEWVGIWNQSSPRRSGTMKLRGSEETGSWKGTQTDESDGQIFIYTIERKSNLNPQA